MKKTAKKTPARTPAAKTPAWKPSKVTLAFTDPKSGKPVGDPTPVNHPGIVAAVNDRRAIMEGDLQDATDIAGMLRLAERDLDAGDGHNGEGKLAKRIRALVPETAAVAAKARERIAAFDVAVRCMNGGKPRDSRMTVTRIGYEPKKYSFSVNFA